MNWESIYLKIYQKANPYKTVICLGNTFLTYLYYGIYPLLLLYVFFYHAQDLLKMICIPGASFCIVSYARKKIGRKRPYEVFHSIPMISKDTKNNAMPSRHIFSAFVITMAVLYYNVLIGRVLFFLAIIESVIRVIGGVHFVSDVVVGAMLGILSGILLFLI